MWSRNPPLTRPFLGPRCPTCGCLLFGVLALADFRAFPRSTTPPRPGRPPRLDPDRAPILFHVFSISTVFYTTGPLRRPFVPEVYPKIAISGPFVASAFFFSDPSSGVGQSSPFFSPSLLPGTPFLRPKLGLPAFIRAFDITSPFQSDPPHRFFQMIGPAGRNRMFSVPFSFPGLRIPAPFFVFFRGLAQSFTGRLKQVSPFTPWTRNVGCSLTPVAGHTFFKPRSLPVFLFFFPFPPPPQLYARRILKHPTRVRLSRSLSALLPLWHLPAAPLFPRYPISSFCFMRCTLFYCPVRATSPSLFFSTLFSGA